MFRRHSIRFQGERSRSSGEPPGKTSVPLVPLLSVHVTSIVPVTQLVRAGLEKEKSLKSVSSDGVKIRSVRAPPLTGFIVAKPDPVSTFPVVSTVIAFPWTVPPNVETSEFAVSIKKSVPASHFECPQLVSITKVACAALAAPNAAPNAAAKAVP